MADFLDLIETISAGDASVDRLFSGEGRRVRSRTEDPKYKAALAEAATFVAEVFSGKRRSYQLSEAMSTSDFPLLFGDIMDRQLLAAYREWPVGISQIARSATVRDFREVKRYTVDGGGAVLEKVKELTEYPEAALNEGEYGYRVNKYGKKLPFSWEAMINDDLDALQDSPRILAASARRSEERFITDLFVGTDGPDGTFFAAGNANVVTGNPALSIASLQTAFTVLAAQTDSDGNPIMIDGVYLVVPPALEVTARNILNATQLEIIEAGGTTNQRLITANWMANRTTLIVDPWIPVLATNNKNTSWFLFASPSGQRPALEIGRLRGHEEPAVFVKEPNARRVGGGAVDPMDGDFDLDAVEYKVRHVFGGTLMDPKMAVASQGDGS